MRADSTSSGFAFPAPGRSGLLLPLAASLVAGFILGLLIALGVALDQTDLSVDDFALPVLIGGVVGLAHGAYSVAYWSFCARPQRVTLLDDQLVIRRRDRVVETVPRSQIVLAKVHPHQIRSVNLWLAGYLEEAPRLTIWCRDGSRIRSRPLYIRRETEGQAIQEALEALEAYVRESQSP